MKEPGAGRAGRRRGDRGGDRGIDRRGADGRLSRAGGRGVKESRAVGFGIGAVGLAEAEAPVVAMLTTCIRARSIAA